MNREQCQTTDGWKQQLGATVWLPSQLIGGFRLLHLLATQKVSLTNLNGLIHHWMCFSCFLWKYTLLLLSPFVYKVLLHFEFMKSYHCFYYCWQLNKSIGNEKIIHGFFCPITNTHLLMSLKMEIHCQLLGSHQTSGLLFWLMPFFKFWN